MSSIYVRYHIWEGLVPVKVRGGSPPEMPSSLAKLHCSYKQGGGSTMVPWCLLHLIYTYLKFGTIGCGRGGPIDISSLENLL